MDDIKQKKYALLVGVDNYLHSTDLPDLRLPLNDVKAFEKILRESPECDFEINVLSNPSNQDLRTLLADILTNQAKNNDMVFFYFSGHGKLSSDGDLCLCTKDANPLLLDTTAVDLPWLKKKIDSTRASQVVLLLDCCYSGAAIGSFKGSMDDVIKKGIGPGKGKYLITSSNSIQPSLELASDDVSLFTKWMLAGLESWDADKNDDGILTIEELYNYASEKTSEEIPTQIPQNYVFGTTPADIIIAEKEESNGQTEPIDSAHINYLNIVKPLFNSGNIIPLFGEGVFASGPLSAFSVMNALAAKAGINMDGQQSCATAAEFLYRMLDNRTVFLMTLKEILQEQQDEVKIKTIHKSVSDLADLKFVVSATYDTKLEDYLIEIERPFTIVSHIIYSPKNEFDGLIQVLRVEGKKVTSEKMHADEFLLNEKELTIYKILGSPFLEDFCEDSKGIDTVIITESDHTKFLAYLENQSTKVPEAFIPSFSQSALLFLGYNLDTWHYRLVGRIFSRSGYAQATKDAYAIRQPTSPIEELFWERLGTKLIRSDVESIAHAFLS